VTNFKEVVEAHLQTIQQRDIGTFSSYFHPEYECSLILPTGCRCVGNDAIVDFHKEWFKDTDWQMSYEIVDTFCGGDFGYALLDVTYDDVSQDGEPYQLNYWLSLLFKKVDNKWILLRDQNTMKEKDS